MRVVIQRVRRAGVSVDGETISEIGPGLLVLLGITHGDGDEEVQFVADKIAGLRIFEDDEGKMNVSAKDAGADMLVVSQFTLYGDIRKGRRPSFTDAARPEQAEPLYEQFIETLRNHGFYVASGRFGARMNVSLENDGPVTLLFDTSDRLQYN